MINDRYPLLGKLLEHFGVGADSGPAPPDMGKFNKVKRAFFLFMHTMLLLCMVGYYTVFMPTRPAGGFLCVATAHGVLGVFYKPQIVSVFYGMNHLLDMDGQMLDHN